MAKAGSIVIRVEFEMSVNDVVRELAEIIEVLALKISDIQDVSIKSMLSDINGRLDNMVTQADVDAIGAQLDKAKGEIIAEIARLQTANPALDLSALTTKAQALDDLNVDVLVTPPAPPVDPGTGTPPATGTDPSTPPGGNVAPATGTPADPAPGDPANPGTPPVGTPIPPAI